jgi:hypothetical protein
VIPADDVEEAILCNGGVLHPDVVIDHPVEVPLASPRCGSKVIHSSLLTGSVR